MLAFNVVDVLGSRRPWTGCTVWNTVEDGPSSKDDSYPTTVS